ncbi:MAG TPA: hypothetical protein VHV49_02550, partial [Pseudonocardiaceae bacterium]|nr:hypothetical protein [Pseudonocardiaceae bacterium]
MSDPGYNEVTIKVTAANDTGKTRDEVEAEWKSLKDIAVKINAQLVDGDEFLADAQALSNAGSDHAVHIPVRLANGDEFLAEVRALVNAAGDTSIKVPVEVQPPVVPRPRKAPDPVDVPTRAENPIDAAWRAKVAASVRALSKDFLKVPVTADTEQLRANLPGSLAELRDISKVKLTMEPEDAADLKAGVDERIRQIRTQIDVPIRAQADAAKLRADMDKAVAKATAGDGVKVPVDVDTSKAQASTRQGMQLVTKLIIAGVAAGATPAGGLLAAALDTGFIGLAVLANKSNAEVVASYKTMATTVVAEVRGASASTVPFIAQSAASMQQTVGELRDELTTSFRAAGPDLRTLTAGVDQFALNAMPGMTDSLRNSQPVIQGTASLIASLGESVGDSFGTMSQRAGAYGVAVQDLGPLTS